MFGRAIGVAIVLFWGVAMAWLVAHDVWPRWLAEDTPPQATATWIRQHDLESEQTIYDEFGPMGKIWTVHLIDKETIRREDVIFIERLPVPVATPLRVVISSSLTPQGQLDEITVKLHNNDVDIRLHGERFHSDFSFMLESGVTRKTFKVPLVDGRMISASFNPFAQMASLKPGQSWRVQVVNPLTLLTGIGRRFTSILVQVTDHRHIDTGRWSGMCFVLEGGDAKAWVDADGVVRRQEVRVPVLGTLRMVRESEVDEETRARVRHGRVHGIWEHQP